MFNKPSDFEIIEINQEARILLLEDPNMGLQVEVPLKPFKLATAKLIDPMRSNEYLYGKEAIDCVGNFKLTNACFGR